MFTCAVVETMGGESVEKCDCAFLYLFKGADIGMLYEQGSQPAQQLQFSVEVHGCALPFMEDHGPHEKGEEYMELLQDFYIRCFIVYEDIYENTLMHTAEAGREPCFELGAVEPYLGEYAVVFAVGLRGLEEEVIAVYLVFYY